VYLASEEKVHDFGELIKKLSGEDITHCYQCGKCTAGCPMAVDMDIMPNQVMRLVQINSKQRVLSSSAIWVCLTCETCSTRCPEEVDIAKIMDTLRKISMKEGYESPERDITEMNRIFLGSIERHGRLSELEMSVLLNLAARKPFKDIGLGMKMFAKGKISLMGSNVKDKEQIKSIFDNSRRFIKEKE